MTIPPGPGFHWFHPKPSQAVEPFSDLTVLCGTLCSSIKSSAGFQRGENSSEIRCILTGDLLIQTPIKSPKYFIWVACFCITLHRMWLFRSFYQHYNPLSCCYPKIISHDLGTPWSKYTCTCTNYKFFRCFSWRAPRKKSMYVYFNYTTIQLQKHNCGT